MVSYKFYKKIGVFYGLLFLFFISLNVFAQKRCLTTEHDSVMAQRYKDWVLEKKRFIESVNEHMKSPQSNARTLACDVIRIPVVVHVVHNNTSNFIGGGSSNPNITDAQINNQIRVLNEDYRRKSGSNGSRNALGVDTGIEFFLAKIDPNGKPTTGITRHLYTAQADFDINTDDKIMANIVSWPSDKYLNIWVAKYRYDYLGLAQFPSVAGIKGLDENNALIDKTDGVFIDYRVFGTGGAVTSRLYKLGRTTTHEVGHWLGLLHTWGDTFCGDDYCDDVPIAERANQTTLTTCNSVFSNCNGKRTQNLIEDYMDYSPDTCMSVFTACQAARMRAVMEKSPRRAKLARSACALLPSVEEPYIEIAPNPTAGDIVANVYVKDFISYTLEIYDTAGRNVYKQDFTDYPSWTHTISSTSLANGTYIIVVKLPDRRITKKVVLAR